ncbi:hypothetical protein PWT90_05860 [Aphanocladium album]|nr:hypothetical protein PWT90_05860 [Aphanocladium album]
MIVVARPFTPADGVTTTASASDKQLSARLQRQMLHGERNPEAPHSPFETATSKPMGPLSTPVGISQQPQSTTVSLAEALLFHCSASAAVMSQSTSPETEPHGVENESDTTACSTKPSWTKLKTKAGKQRRRLPLACTSCRNKKVRCSGEQPSCKNCAQVGRQCTYNTTSRRGIFRHSLRSIQTLQSEQDLQASDGVDLEPNFHFSESLPCPSSQQTGPAVDDKTKTQAESCETAPNSGNLLDLRNTLHATAGDDGPELPAKDLQAHLFDVFFEHVHGEPFYLLHRPSCMAQLRNHTLPKVLIMSVCAVSARFSRDPRLISGSCLSSAGDKWATQARKICKGRQEQPDLVILTCLILLCMQDVHDGYHDRGWSLSGQAIRMAFALRLHEDLRRDPETMNGEHSLNFRDRETRRRAMWACILVDRLTSLYLHRPVFIYEATIEVPPPVSERFFELDGSIPIDLLENAPNTEWDVFSDLAASRHRDNLGVTTLMMKSLMICRQTIMLRSRLDTAPVSGPSQKDLSQLKVLASEADALQAILPAQLGWSDANAQKQLAGAALSHYTILHLSIAMSSIFICQSAVHIPKLNSATVTCVRAKTTMAAQMLVAARLISRVLSQVETLKPATFSPFAGYCALLSMRVQSPYLTNTNSRVKDEAEKNIATGLHYLRRLAQLWRPFDLIVDHIDDQCEIFDGLPMNKVLQYQACNDIHQFAGIIMTMDLVDPRIGYDWEDLTRSALNQLFQLHSHQSILFDSFSVERQNQLQENPTGPYVESKEIRMAGGAAGPSQKQPTAPADNIVMPMLRNFSREPVQDHEDANTKQSASQEPFTLGLPATFPYEGTSMASVGSEPLPVSMVSQRLTAAVVAPEVDMDAVLQALHPEVDNGGWYGLSGNVSTDMDYLSACFLPFVDNGQQHVGLQDDLTILAAAHATGGEGEVCTAATETHNRPSFHGSQEWCV